MKNQPGSYMHGGVEDSATPGDDGVWRDGGAILSCNQQTGRVRVLLPGALYGLEFTAAQALDLFAGLELVADRLREIVGESNPD